MSELEKKFLGLLQAAVQQKSSDVHLMTGQPPVLRSHEGLTPVGLAPFTAEEMQSLCQFMISDPQTKAAISTLQDVDGSFEIKGLCRFRYNIYRTVLGLGAVLRVIAQKVPTLDDLRLPPVLKKVAEASRGLILVTGATGSGKSSTLAAMIDHLNSTQNLHILTIEDPIEFQHHQKKCRLSQREIGRDTKNFAVALKSALRQDPDVILVGEMRDHETLDIALKASETGHLVFSTVHTSDAMKTIGRLTSLFPPEEQQSARLRIADNLHAIVSQRLIPGKEGGKVVAQEILINNLGISDCIASEKKTSEIPGFIEKGKEVSGMQTFDQHLADLYQQGQITLEVALESASNPSDFQRNLAFGANASDANSGRAPAEASLTLHVETVEPKAEAPTESSEATLAQPPSHTNRPPPPLPKKVTPQPASGELAAKPPKPNKAA